MAELSVAQIAKEDADQAAEGKEDGPECAQNMYINQREEEPRVFLLIDVRLVARVHCEHLSIFLGHSRFRGFSSHDVLVKVVICEAKSGKWPHPRSVR
jgi:hypothetical protein